MKKGNFFNKIHSLFSNKEIDQETANEIKGYVDSLGRWKLLMGTLCFNIWHSTKDDFEKSKDYLDMEFPFLCALYIFHNWDRCILSKKYSIPELLPEVNQAVINVKNALIKRIPETTKKIEFMTSMRKLNSQMKIEPSKIFISIFTENQIEALSQLLAGLNPLDFFQIGLEILLLFTLEIKEKNKEFYNLIEDIGPYDQEDAEEILKQINSVSGK
jgi:hypothetical protein